MADISIQFHAVPSELQVLTSEVLKAHALHVVAMRFFPFEAVEIGSTRLAEVFEEKSAIKRLLFTLGRPSVPVANELEFADRNPDHLRLDVGRKTENGLEQSWLTARTENREALRVWRKIAHMLKEVTSEGVLAINQHSGVSAVMKSARYSQVAKTLEAAGMRMLPPQGPNGPKLVLGLKDT